MDMAEALAREARKFRGPVVLGPAPDSISRLKDFYRQVFYVKDADYERLSDVKDALEEWRRVHPVGNTSVQYDFDPQ